jgi:hypothetical protein
VAATIATGTRLHEPAAVAYEEAHEMAGFGRRLRITAGNIEQLREIPNLLWPPRPLVLFCFSSSKAALKMWPARVCGRQRLEALKAFRPFISPPSRIL